MNKLQQYYLKPYSFPYVIIHYLLNYKWLVILFITILILTYPSYQLSQAILEKKHAIKINSELNNRHLIISKQLRKLGVKERVHRINPLLINKDIKNILSNNQINIEEIEWNNEGNHIDIIFNQKFRYVMRSIIQLNNHKKLSFNQITLTKMNKDFLVQCVLNLTISEG